MKKVICNKQRKYCVFLQKKEKKKYFANLNEKVITNNEKFWHPILQVIMRYGNHPSINTIRRL